VHVGMSCHERLDFLSISKSDLVVIDMQFALHGNNSDGTHGHGNDISAVIVAAWQPSMITIHECGSTTRLDHFVLQRNQYIRHT
jgi:hypothetical protein